MASELEAVAGHTVRIRGQAAALRWGYRLAASLGAWEVAQTPREGAAAGGPPRIQLAAAIAGDVSLFAVRQRPLTFVVMRPGYVSLRWPVLALELGAESLTATLGPRETG